jgi:light-regulated signal transduction histidine kinase (bacteriophytochrome)
MIIGLHDFIDIKSSEHKFTNVDLSLVLEKSMRELNNEILKTKTRIKSDKLPVVKGDEKQLSRLFFSLLDNAIKFRGQNPPEIDVTSKEEDDQWQIKINDNGIGIDPAYNDEVFHIFKTLHPKNRYGGRGIGLSISKQIVKRHNGRIWIEAEPGKGTAIIFTIKKKS